MTIEALEQRRNKAAADVTAAMERLHPIGSEVAVILSYRQMGGSHAEIVAAYGSDSTYRVRLVKPDRRGIRRCKSVHWSKVSKW